MSWTSFIAWRYFKSKKKDTFVNLATKISIFTSTLTIVCLILSFSIFRGYNDALIEKLTKNSGHIVITDSEPFNPKDIADKINLKNEKVAESYGLISSGTFSIPTFIYASSNRLLKKISDSDVIPIVISKSLADLMHYKPSDVINIIIPVPAPAPFFILPENISCEIVKIETFENDDLNENGILANLSDLQKILNIDSKVHKIKCFSSSLNNIDQDFKKISKIIPDKHVYHWKDLNEFFLKVIKSEKNIFMILLFILVILSSLLYVLAISMFINSKKRDIRVLKILGASKSNINSIFLQYSIILYSANLLFGTILGILLTKNINNFIKLIERAFKITIFDKDLYLISYIPVKLNFFDIAYVMIFLFIISFLSSFWISRKISSIDVFKNL